LPEVSRVDLVSAVLQIHEWGKTDPRRFHWFEMPPENRIASAESLLAMLGALDSPENGSITPIGRKMLQYPLHPRLARMMLTAVEKGIIREAATLAALLSEKDIFRAATALHPRQRATQGRSDLLYRMELLHSTAASDFASIPEPMDRHAARQVWKTRRELLNIIPATTSRDADEDELLKLILLAYPDRVCMRRDSNADAATMVGGFGVRIDPSSIVISPRLLVALDARDDSRSTTREATARILSEVNPQWLDELFPHALSTRREVLLDHATGKAVCHISRCFGDLVIEKRLDQADGSELAATLA